MSEIVVSGLALTPVKGTRLRAVQRVRLESGGAVGNRCFYVIDERDRMLNGKQLGELQTVRAEYSEPRLSLTFPDGRVVSGAVELDAAIETRFFTRTRAARLVRGPWSQELSILAGQPLRLVRAGGDGGAVDRGARGAASLISRASMARLAEVAQVPEVDSRRFRMLIEVDGVDAHAEDAWVGRKLRVGGAVIAWRGHVGRCVVTSRDPESGEVDLPTLDILRGYRGELETTEPLPFGVYGEVLEPGEMSVGDAIRLV